MILKRYVTVLVFIVAHVALWMGSRETAPLQPIVSTEDIVISQLSD